MFVEGVRVEQQAVGDVHGVARTRPVTASRGLVLSSMSPKGLRLRLERRCPAQA
ncbi:hypothetical protein [Kitasatospora sp. LaBMicrA B282]|uniref:hypothetical protein n=1 Tax=Kitasatospora sp. LaBMicrA B282 TaxID=3420949 RepID=UPI003D11CB6F